jgi:hypothetical protein
MLVERQCVRRRGVWRLRHGGSGQRMLFSVQGVAREFCGVFQFRKAKIQSTTSNSEAASLNEAGTRRRRFWRCVESSADRDLQIVITAQVLGDDWSFKNMIRRYSRSTDSLVNADFDERARRWVSYRLRLCGIGAALLFLLGIRLLRIQIQPAVCPRATDDLEFRQNSTAGS